MTHFSNVDASPPRLRVDPRAALRLRSAERPHAPGPLSPIFKGGAHARLSRAVTLTINAFLEP